MDTRGESPHALKRFALAGVAFSLTLASVAAHAQQSGDTTLSPAAPDSATDQDSRLLGQPFESSGSGANNVDSNGDASVQQIGTGADTREKSTRRAFSTEFGLRLDWTGSDNLSRLPEAQAQEGQLYEISPYITASMAGPVSWINLFAGANFQQGLTWGFKDLPGKSTGTGYRVTADGDISLTGDNALRIEPEVILLKTSAFSSGLTSDNLGLQNDNTYALVSLSPYSKGNLGGGIEYLLRYTGRYVDPTGGQPTSLTNRLNAEVGSRTFSDAGFGWAARVDGGRIDFEDDRSYDTLVSDVTVEYLFGRRLRVGLGVNYASYEDVVADDGKTDGIGPVLTWEWRPAKSTLLAGRIAQNYFGDVATVSFKRNTGRWATGVSYTQGIEDSNSAGALFFQPRDAFTVGSSSGWDDQVSQGLVDRNAVLGSATPLAFDTLSSPLVYNKTLYLSGAYVTTRSTVLGVLYRNQMEAAVLAPGVSVPDGLTRNGVNLEWAYRLTRRQEVSFSLAHRTSRPDSGGFTTRSSAFGLGWQTRISPRLIGGVSYRHVREDGREDGQVATENAVSATLDYRF